MRQECKQDPKGLQLKSQCVYVWLMLDLYVYNIKLINIIAGQNTSKETFFLEFQNQRDMKSEVYESVFMFGQT